jgi:hypothetical protein
VGLNGHFQKVVHRCSLKARARKDSVERETLQSV